MRRIDLKRGLGIIVVAPVANAQKVTYQVVVIADVVYPVYIGGVKDKQGGLVIEVEKTRVSVIQTFQIIPGDRLFGGDTPSMNALKQC